jgi:RNA polymerase sigma-70 factor, ECF subfamily
MQSPRHTHAIDHPAFHASLLPRPHRGARDPAGGGAGGCHRLGNFDLEGVRTLCAGAICEPRVVGAVTFEFVKSAESPGLVEKQPPPSARVLRFPERGLSDADDETLVRVLREGDPRAPRLVWQRFAPMVHRVLRRTFGPGQDIDDLVQDVFLVLFARVGTLREPKALPAFVLSIAAHTVRRELRRRAALRWLQFGEPPIGSVPGANLDSREAVARLYGILDGLRPGDRTAFVLRHFEGLDVVDVAEAMDISLATTKRRLARAWDRVVMLGWRDPALVDYVKLEPERGS